MKETFRSLYRRVVDPEIPRFVRNSYRLYPDYKMTNIRTANFEEWKRSGFSDLEKENLARTLYEDNEYAIVAHIKNATDTDYDLMLIVLPKGDNSIVHTMDALPENVLKSFCDWIGTSAKKIEEISSSHGDELKRLYIHQHVGLYELNSYPFNISFPQIHMHVMGVTQRDLDASQIGINRFNLIKRENRNSYSDPMIFFARDICEHIFGKKFEIDEKTSSIILDKRPIDLKVNVNDRRMLPTLYYWWHQWWAMSAMIFSNLEFDENNRLDINIPPAQREENLRLFFETFPFFSDESKIFLTYLVKNIKNFDPNHVKEAAYSGMAGSVGWVHNFDSNETELRFGPRFLTSSKKMGASDGLYVGIKDKSQFLPEPELSNRLSIQREIFSKLK